MKNIPNISKKQGIGRFAIIPETVLRSDAYRALKPSARDVYAALALHANAARECDPAMDTLAEIADVDRSTARKATKKMVELGLITKQIGGGRNNTNRYRLIDDPDGENPGQPAGVLGTENPGEVAGVSSVNPGEPAPKPRPPRRGNIQEQTYMNGDVGSSRVEAVRRALSDAGITGPNLDRLAGRGDLTVEYVNAHAAIAKDRATKNPAGLLVSMIESGQRPASQPDSTPNAGNDFTRPSSREEAADLFPPISN